MSALTTRTVQECLLQRIIRAHDIFSLGTARRSGIIDVDTDKDGNMTSIAPLEFELFGGTITGSSSSAVSGDQSSVPLSCKVVYFPMEWQTVDHTTVDAAGEDPIESRSEHGLLRFPGGVGSSSRRYINIESDVTDIEFTTNGNDPYLLTSNNQLGYGPSMTTGRYGSRSRSLKVKDQFQAGLLTPSKLSTCVSLFLSRRDPCQVPDRMTESSTCAETVQIRLTIDALDEKGSSVLRMIDSLVGST